MPNTLPEPEKSCTTCRFVITKEGTSNRCNAYRAGAYPVRAETALSDTAKCGPLRNSWQAPETETQIQANAEQVATILEAGGPRAKLLQFLTKRQS